MAKSKSWNVWTARLLVVSALLVLVAPAGAASISGTPRIAERQSTISMRGAAALQARFGLTNLLQRTSNSVPYIDPRDPRGTNQTGGGGIGAASDPLIGAASAGGTVRTSPPPAASFQALPDDLNTIPPDTHGAVGPNHVMTVLNSQVRIQDRQGNVKSTVQLEAFWTTLGVTDVFDPKVYFDPYEGRWIFVACAERLSPRSGLVLAVSQDDNPEGNWFRYLLDGDATDTLWVDYPNVGFNKDWIVVSVNMFPIFLGTGRTHLFVVDKADVYGNGIGRFTLIQDTNSFTMAPTLTYDNSLSTMYLVDDPAFNQTTTFLVPSSRLRVSTITGPKGAETLTVGTSFVTPGVTWRFFQPFASGSLPQLGSNFRISGNDSRLQNVVYRNGSLWATHHVWVPETLPTRAAAQWYQFTTDGQILQFGRVEDTNGVFSYAFPSIAVNSVDDVLLGFSRFSPTTYASAAYAFRSKSDPTNTMQYEQVFKAGEAPYFKTFGGFRNRWGDYSGTVVDPANDLDMWTIQEYAMTPLAGFDRWGTWWAMVSASGGARFDFPNYSVGEAPPPGEATIVVVNSAGTPGSVDWVIRTNGTAQAGANYVSDSTGTLTFSNTQTSASFKIRIVDDFSANADRTIQLTLTNPQGGLTLGYLTNAVLTIVDDETRVTTSQAGEFNFSSWIQSTGLDPFYYGTMNETDFDFWCYPGYFIDRNRSPLGMLVTVVRTNGNQGKVLVDYETLNNGFALPFCDYTPVKGTLVFEEYQNSASFLVPLRNFDNLFTNINCFFSVSFFSNFFTQIDMQISNPRAAPEEQQERPGLIRPTLGQGSFSSLILYDVGLGVPTFNRTNLFPTFVNGVAFERLHYRFDEFEGRDPQTGSGSVTFEVSIINPFGVSGRIHMMAYQHARGAGWGGINNFPFGVAGSTLTLLNQNVLDAGSDFASAPIGGAELLPSPKFTDATFGDPLTFSFTNVADYIPINLVEINFGGCRQETTITILNDSTVEFNEDIILQLVRLGGDLPLSPYASIANVTILYNDQPAGAVDREWNADNVEGTPDRSYNLTPGANNIVNSVVVQPDNKTLLAGDFTALNTKSRNRIGRMNADGSVDNGFTVGTGADGSIASMLLYPPGSPLFARIVIGGGFSSYNGTARNSLARLMPNGLLDTSFVIGNGANGTIRAMALQPDGKILIAGDFTEYNNFTRNGLARINTDGSLDFSFDAGSGADSLVWSVAVLPGGRIAIGGDFQSYQGIERSRIAVLQSNGNLDQTFDPGGGANSSVYAVAVQADGMILMAGAFNEVDARQRVGIARLSSAGDLDPSFDPGTGPDGPIYSLALDGAGKAMVGGPFIHFNGTRRVGLARLRYDGTVDTSFLDTAYNQFAGLINSFSFEPPNYVNSIAMGPDGNVMIGGSFKQIGGNPSFTADVPNHYTQFTRQDKRARYNIARLLGGATPGPGNMEFEVEDYTVDENGGVASVRLERVDGRLGTSVASVGTSDRTASIGVDFVNTNLVTLWPEAFYQTNNDLTFPIYFPTNFAPISVGLVDPIYLRVPLIDDPLREGDESVDLNFLRPQGSITLGGDVIPLGAALGRSKARLTILDNDFDAGTFAFAAANFVTNENALRATITVIRTNGANGSASVDYFTDNVIPVPATPGTGPGGDYSPASGRLTFASGQTVATFQVTIVNDTLVEFDENIRLVLTNAVGARLGTNATVIVTSALTIVDNDFPNGRINMVSTNVSGSEADGFVMLQVARTGGNAAAVSVDYQTIAGTAAAGSDYTTTSGTLVWNDGDSSSKTITVALAADGLPEASEYFFVRLSNGRVSGLVNTNLLALRTNAAIHIADADAYGTVAFEQPVFVADENGGTASITVTRSGGVAGTGTVAYATSGLLPTDISGTLTFLPGEISRIISVPLADDTIANSEFQSVGLILSGAVNVSLGSPSAAILRIVDNESFNEPAGEADTLFPTSTQANGPVFALALQRTNNFVDGRVIVAGDFTQFNQVVRNRLARLMTNGTLDTTFDPGPGANDTIRTIVAQPDGRLLIGGFFTQIISTNRNRIARLNIDGSLDGSFNPGAGADSAVLAMMLQPDGKILAAGNFSSFNSISRPGIVRLNTNGSVDLTFNAGAGPNGPVYAVALQSDGKILIGGEFSSVNGVARTRVARLNANGTLDTTFDPGVGPNDSVRALAFQPDGGIVIGGSFTSVSGTTRGYLARLTSSGALDTTYMASVPGANGTVFALALQPDGRVVVAGDFTQFNSVTRNRLTRLNTDGTSDPTINFGSGTDAFVAALAIQPDRKIILGGGFTTYDGQRRLRIARIHGGSIYGNGSLEFVRSEFLVGESATNGVVTIRRRGGTIGSVGVNFQTSDGSAVAGVDYQTVAGVLTFPEAETFQAFVVPIIDNFTPQGDRSLNLTLLNGTYTGGAVPGPQPFSTLRILDDEGTIGFSSATFTENEGVPSQLAAITVVRTGATNAPVTVSFATTTGGTATAPVDYISTNGTLSFLPGELTKSFQIRLIDDNAGEGTESVRIVLSNPSNSNTLTTATATLLITDNEFAPGTFTFSAPTNSVSEIGTNVLLTINRVGGGSGLATITYRTTDSTAIGGLDFAGTNVVLAFADGEVSKTIAIGIIDDLLVEARETFNVVLSNPTGGAALGGISSAQVSILDNDISTITNAGATLITENLITNNVIDPGETVTMSFGLRNVGSGDTANLVATLLPGSGVANPSGAQNYGALLASGAAVSRTFTFTANGAAGDNIEATLLLTDSGFTNGFVRFPFTVGGAASRTFSYTNGTIVINDSTGLARAASPYPAGIEVANLGGTITSVSVSLTNFSHGNPEDVDILLVGPEGQRVTLMSDAGYRDFGADAAVTNITLRFSDAAATTLPGTNLLQSGLYRPANYAGPNMNTADLFDAPVIQPAAPPNQFPYTNTALAVFNGSRPIGTWSLYVMDDRNLRAGSIAGWSLRIDTTDPIVAASGNSAADLALTATPATGTVILGGNVTSVLTVTNRGPATAIDVAVLDQMAPGLTVVSGTPTVGTWAKVGNTLTWVIGTMPVGGTARLTLVTSPSLIGSYPSIATVAANQADPNLANNSAMHTATAINVPTLAYTRVGNTLTLSWAANSGYRLQSATSLTPANWADVTEAPQVNGNGQNILNVGVGGAGKFYRLRSP